MSEIVRYTQCPGCAKIFPVYTHSRRKWCTEACRKRTLYSTPCIECGAPTNGSDGPGAHKRCRDCSQVRVIGITKDKAAARQQMVADLWAAGWTGREICAAMGVPYRATAIAQWRSRGANLPHRSPPELVARLTELGRVNLAKARAARRAA